MDYTRIYIELIERSFERTLSGYIEKHHIVPKCMGGDNKPRNIAVLTPEEHFLAHQLLVKIYPKNKKLIFAANMMGQTRKCNKSYGWLKRKAANSQIGRKHSEETKLKMSNSTKGEKHPLYGKKHSDSAKLKQSKAAQKRIGPANGFFGKNHNQSTKAKIAEARQKPVECLNSEGQQVAIYISMTDAQSKTGIFRQSINRSCSYPDKKAGGLYWRFLTNTD